MKLLLSSLNFSPELTGIGKYSGEMAQALVERGHEVVVVCAPPYYPHWKVAPGYSSAQYKVERPHPRLTIIRCPLWVPRQPTAVKRLLHLMSFALSSFPVMLALALWRPAVVFQVVPAFFCAPAAWLTARFAGARSWLHVQDFELDAAFELGLLKGSLVRTLSQVLERALMRRFDDVSTISRRMLRQLASKGIPLDQGRLLPNWVDLRGIRPEAGPSTIRQELGLGNDKVVFLFSGTMNRKQGLPILFDALDLLSDRSDIVMVLCGSGDQREDIERRAAGRSNVKLLDLQPADRLNDLLNAADVHLLPQDSGAADLVMPSKLGGMLASGRPVVASAFAGTEIASVVEGRGLTVSPGDAKAFAAAMRRLVEDKDERERLGRNARAHAMSALDKDRMIQRIEAAITGSVDAADPAIPSPDLRGGRSTGV
jgi:colanic acid biosynthesis glycosyl transferase WcaI